MIEKVNPMHPDKIADRIAGALVDIAYRQQEKPKVAVEVLIGHGTCRIIVESSVKFYFDEVEQNVFRIAKTKDLAIDLIQAPQDVRLANNQKEEYKCGDNGIFKGMPLTQEEKELSKIARDIYSKYQIGRAHV